MTGPEIIFQPTEALVGGIYALDDPSRLMLLDVQQMEKPFVSVASSASLIQKGDSFGKLYLSAELELVPLERDPYVAAMEAVNKLQHDHQSYRTRLLARGSGHGAFMVEDRVTHDISTLVSPRGAGQSWWIQSALGTFRFEQGKDQEGIETVLWQHAHVLNALSGAIRDKLFTDVRVPRSRSRSRVFQLSMPQHYEDDAVGIGSETKVVADQFETFVGLDTATEQLREMVLLADADPGELARAGIEKPQSVMFWGPSGVAKSALITALAQELEADERRIDLSDISATLVGEWAKNLEQIFTTAFASGHRVLIVMEEMDGLVSSGNPEVSTSINTVLKTQLERLADNPHVFFAGSTNHIDKIDPIIRANKRMHIKIPIALPQEEERALIFRRYLFDDLLAQADASGDISRTMELLAGQEAIDLQELARQTVDFSGGDIKTLIATINRGRYIKRLKEKKASAVADSARVDTTATPIVTQQELLEAIARARLTKQ